MHTFLQILTVTVPIVPTDRKDNQLFMFTNPIGVFCTSQVGQRPTERVKLTFYPGDKVYDQRTPWPGQTLLLFLLFFRITVSTVPTEREERSGLE